MTGRARVLVCPRCGSVASHLRANGLRQCDAPACSYVGRNKTYRGGGPVPRHRWLNVDNDHTTLLDGGSRRVPRRYDT